MCLRQVWLSAAAIAVVALPAGAETFTLKEALGVTYETNPQLDAARAGLRATDENVATANANFRPSLSIGGSYGFEKIPPFLGGAPTSEPLSGQLSVNQTVLNYSDIAQISKAKSQVKAGRAQLTSTEESVLLAAVTAYMNVVRDEATVKLRENNVSVLQKQRDATQEQFKVGELTRTDVAQSQARLAGAQADLIYAEGQLAISRADFEHQIGRPAETLEAEPALPVLPKEQQAAIDMALKLNPDVLAARQNVKAADHQVDVALGALMPNLTVNGQYQYTQNNPSYGPFTIHALTVLGNLNVPIYQGGAEDAAVRQAKELRGQAELTADDTERQVIYATRAAWQAYTSAMAAIASNEAQVDANKVAYQGVKLEQQVGARTILDVLNAEQELLNSQVNLVSSKRDAAVAAYQLLSAVGTLTARGLALNVRTYDPLEHYDDNAGRWVGLGD
ncbi:MAG TPA: TolC family outer membrane protein [Rhizomicrobium sp.]|nr:TolC family outer membrane protein [Rhizomicrobium sp.]